MNNLDLAVKHGAYEHGDRGDSDYSIEFSSACQLDEFIADKIRDAKKEALEEAAEYLSRNAYQQTTVQQIQELCRMAAELK